MANPTIFANVWATHYKASSRSACYRVPMAKAWRWLRKYWSPPSVRETIKRPLGNPSLKELMDGGQTMYGMQTFEAHIKSLVRDGIVDREVGRAAMGF